MLTALVWAVALAVSAMCVAWAVAVATNRFSWIDALWSLAVGGCSVIMLSATPSMFEVGQAPRRALVGFIVLCWSLRLGVHLIVRSVSNGQDPRYLQLRRDWKQSFRPRLFWFLQLQGGVAVALAIGVGIVASRTSRAIDLSDWMGGFLCLAAIAGEAISDRQLNWFRRRTSDLPNPQGEICSAGFWSLSRHPNYFFEWLFWVGIAVIGLDFTGTYIWGWLGISSPLLMYWLLVHVSGIPPLEAHMLRSRGDAYRDYQRRVSAFWPWPRISEKKLSETK